ncbi:winged helix-turn-helix transcriptional regulator [Aquimarina algicola]|uniref:Helix-turn-helix transcriptional regulator n=1 Tax=Aquimarina algicola TaxID=2589995 RepID=A0A504JKD2_9FLAO|nr:helix-turn-helix domain-containing protein [Aquimarina algicola]TPN87209.1 helix-turn-helix transcriptional regulator [Aquimarina algicola]
MYEKKIPKNFDCGISITVEVIGGKWKPCLIDSINNEIRRPSELQRRHPEASRRVLNLQLKELEEHGVVKKVIYPVLPPKVEYFLTDFGKSLIPVIETMTKWGDANRTFFIKKQEEKKKLSSEM